MTTFTEFRSQIRRQLEEPTEGVWKDESLLYWTNETAAQLSRRSKPSRDEEYTSTVAGTWSYDLPDNTLEVINLLVDGEALMRVDYSELNTLDNEALGKPVLYAITDDEMALFPTPDAEYEVRLFRYRSPAVIAADTDEMPFGSQYNTAIEYGVLNRAFEQINDFNTAEMYRARYEGAVDEMLRQKVIEKGARRSVSPREVY